MDIFLIQDIITLINDIVSSKNKSQIGGSFKDAMKAGSLAKKSDEDITSGSLPNEDDGEEEETSEEGIMRYIILALKILVVIIFLFTAPIVPFIALSYYTYKRVKKKLKDDEDE